MDNPLQNVQDTVSKQWLEESEYFFERAMQYQAINMIPSFIHESYAIYGRSYTQIFKKRPPLDWAWDFTNIPGNSGIFIYSISISSIYNIVIAAYISGTTAYILQHNFGTNSTLTLGSFPVSGISDFIWLSEISQAAGGSTYPGVAVNYMNSTYTTSASYYAYTTTGGSSWSALTKITDTNYPNNQTPALITIGKIINFQDTFFIATLDGRIWNSPAGGRDISTWSNSYGTGSINVSAYPDQCLGLERYKQHIVAFGSNSVEFFDYDTSVLPTALARLDQVFIKFGTISPKLFANFNDIIYWVGYGQSNALGLWKLDGYQPTKISNTGIEDVLAYSFDQGVTVGFSCGRLRGKNTLCLSNVQARNIALVYFTPQISVSPATSNFYGFNTQNFGAVGTLCLNLDDNLWWEFNSPLSPGNQNLFLLPVFNVAATANVSPVNQAAFLTNSNISPVSNSVFTISDNSEDFSNKYWVDTFNPASNINIFGYYYTAISTNPMRFGNTKNKRIDQLSIDRISYVPKFTGPQLNIPDPNTYGGVLIAMRQPMSINASDLTSIGPSTQQAGIINNNVGAPGTTMHFFTFPPKHEGMARQTFNKLGTGRMWAFIYAEVTKSDFITYGYNLNIQQLQH